MLGQEIQIEEEEEEVECGVDVLGVRSLFLVSALVLRPRAAFRIDLAMGIRRDVIAYGNFSTDSCVTYSEIPIDIRIHSADEKTMCLFFQSVELCTSRNIAAVQK